MDNILPRLVEVLESNAGQAEESTNESHEGMLLPEVCRIVRIENRSMLLVPQHDLAELNSKLNYTSFPLMP